MNATTGCHFSCRACFHKLRQLIMWLTCRECGAGEGPMNDRIGRLVASDGVDRTAAEKAVGIVLRFLPKVGRADVVQPAKPSGLYVMQQGKGRPARWPARFPAPAGLSGAR